MEDASATQRKGISKYIVLLLVFIAWNITQIVLLVITKKNSVLMLTVVPILVTGFVGRPRDILVMSILVFFCAGSIKQNFLDKSTSFDYLIGLLLCSIYFVISYAINRYIKINRDLQTEIHKREIVEQELLDTCSILKNTQNQLIQSEKLASIGQLSAGIAHEINNPTGIIIGNLQVLDQYMKIVFEAFKVEDTYKSSENRKIGLILKDTPKLINDTLEGAERIRLIVSGLKDFTHPSKSVVIRSDIKTILEKALSLVVNEVKHNCSVETSYEDTPQIVCNPKGLQQVFVNILMNASQAMKSFGKIIIKSYSTEDDVFVEIADNGDGMSEDILGKIFDPFFTTKDIGKGTGLGLSIAYGIVKDHKGDIHVNSVSGEGTTFKIRIPLEGIEYE